MGLQEGFDKTPLKYKFINFIKRVLKKNAK